MKKLIISRKKYVISVSVLIVAAITGVLLYLFLIRSEYPTQMIGSLPVSLSNPGAMASHNGNLYLINDDKKLLQINLSSPGSSSILLDLPDELTSPSAMAELDGDLYIADYNGKGLWKIDLKDPENSISTPVGFFRHNFVQPASMASHNGALYIATTDRGLWKIDLKDPENSSIIKKDLGLYPFLMTSHNGSLYITEYEDGRIFEIDTEDSENVGNVVHVGLLPRDLKGLRRIVSHKGVLYIVDGESNDLWQINPDDLESGGTLMGYLPGELISSASMTGLGSVLYMVGVQKIGSGSEDANNYRSTLWEIDLNDPQNGSTFLGYLPELEASPYNPPHISSYNGILYISKGLQLWEIDINEPEKSSIVGSLPASGSIAFHNGDLYISDIYRFNIHDVVLTLVKTNLNDLGSRISVGHIYFFQGTMTSHNGGLYATGYKGGLWNIDVSDTEKGSKLIRYLPTNVPYAMASYNGDLYVAANGGQLWKINLDD